MRGSEARSMKVDTDFPPTKPGYLGDSTKPVAEGFCEQCKRHHGKEVAAIARCGGCGSLICEEDYDPYNDRCFMCNP